MLWLMTDIALSVYGDVVAVLDAVALVAVLGAVALVAVNGFGGQNLW